MGNVPFCDKRRQTLKAQTTGWCRGRKELSKESTRVRAEKLADEEKGRKGHQFDVKGVIAGAQLAASTVLLVLHPEHGLLYLNGGLSLGRVFLEISNEKSFVSLASAATTFLLIDGALYAFQGYNLPVMLAVSGLAITTPIFALHDASIIIRKKLSTRATKKESPKQPAPGLTMSGGIAETEVTSQSKTLQRILNWMSPDWFLWSCAYGSLVLGSVLGTTMPVVFTNLVSAVSTPEGDIRGALFRCSGTLLLMTCVASFQSILFAESSTRLSIRIQKKVMSNVLHQEMEFFDNTSPGEIISHMTSVSSITGVAEKMIPNILRSLVTTTTAFVILSQYNIKLAAMCVAAIPLQVALTRWYSRFHTRYAEQLQKLQAKTSRIIAEMISSAKAIKILNGQKQMCDNFWDAVNDLVTLRAGQRWFLVGNGFIEVFLPHMSSMLLFLYAGQLSYANQIDVAQLMTIAMYQRQMTGAFDQIGRVYVGWANMIGTSRTCFEYLDRSPKQMERGIETTESLAGAVEFKNVQFGYSTNPTKVLHDFNLTIRPGEVLAIVGPSGGGKSTVVKLLLGLYDPEEGVVLVDGQPVSRFDPKQWHGLGGVSVVNQDPVLFSMSFRENIALGLNKLVTQEEIEQAAILANAHDFILASKEGYDTKVGNRGEKLSGGQKQRTAIARAIVRNPKILLLDEATSSLDANSEKLVKEAIERSLKGRTVVVVAHRLSTVQNADRILVMSQGQIVQSGTHKELLSDPNGTYTQLVKKQLIGGEELGSPTTPVA
jgi:ATP-binding cassette subfamily B (MDR/TAP) protein 9